MNECEGLSGARPGILKTVFTVAMFLTLMYLAPTASAYCRATTCDPETGDQPDSCRYGNDGCAVNGVPLRWKTGCVSFSVNEAGSKKRSISYDDAHESALRAFETWLHADCGKATPGIEILDIGAASCGEPQYNLHDGNANVILFMDDAWPYDDTFDSLAVTTSTFNTETGEIYDADIAVNSHEMPITATRAEPQYDLGRILIHEVGHFFGLSHSFVPGAVMRGRDIPALVLAPDDMAGICDAYPPVTLEPSTRCAPRHGFSAECAPHESAGCSCGFAGRWRRGSAGAWLGLVLGLALLGRRRRGRLAIGSI